MKYKLTFDNHAPAVFSIEELVNGAAMIFCSKNNCVVAGIHVYSGRSYNGIDFYEGDKVICRGTKRAGEYETELIASRYTCMLKENKTYCVDNAALITVKSLAI